MKCKLLVAEDELIERKVLCRTLQKYLGDLISLYEAKNGREALEIFAREAPQVAVLDIEMPGLTGLEVARQIGKTDTYTVVKAKDYIRKPKKNGYESYHIVLDIPMSYKGKTTVVRVELQLRTMIMDAWAGMDNRVSYKKGVPPEMERRIEKYARIGRRLDKLIQKTLDDSKTV